MRVLLALILFVSAAVAEPLVYKDQYVIEVMESYCPWGTPCSNPLEPGLYLFTGEYLHTQKPEKLEAYDASKEKEQCSRFKGESRVRCFANFYIRTFEKPDPLFAQQWHHAAIKTEQAWQRYGYGSPKTVAVLDTGVDCDGHPDLECITGYNAFADSAGNTVDRFGHGTHVAGIITASIKNGEGVAGIVDAKLMPVKVLGDSGAGSTFTVMRGFKWAMENGANIINMSLGGGGKTEAFQGMIDEAHSRGIYVVAAAGNSNSNIDIRPEYPASYRHVISVGSLNEAGKKSYFSNYGNSVDIWSPGSNILSTDIKGKYSIKSGTSMAAPVVAGAIALLNKLPDGKILQLAKLPCDKEGKSKCFKKCRKKFRCRYTKQKNCKSACSKKFNC